MKQLITALTIMVTLLLTGCQTAEKIAYMQDVPAVDSAFIMKAAEDIKIRPGDKLSIIVNTSIPELAGTFNLAVPYRYVGSNSAFTNQSQNGFYTVDNQGNIDFPVLGQVNVAGMTRNEIATNIKDRIINDKLLKDAVVSVEYGNLTFSVLGEVTAPGRYSFDKDHISLLEAISMAKDLTIMGKRENVLVARADENGVNHTYRVNLCDAKSLFESPVYYVQQNDIIYVEPNDTRARQSTVNGNTALTPSFWISVASLLTTITALIIR